MALLTIVGTPQWSEVAAPVDGTKIVAVSPTSPPPADEGPIRPSLQALTDRSEYAKAGVDLAVAALGPLAGTIQRPTFWRADSNQIVLGAFLALIPDASQQPTGLRVLNSTQGETLLPSDIEPTANDFAANQWYYVYARWSNGQFRIKLRTDPPDEARRFRLAAATDVYLGVAFRTDGSSDPITGLAGASGRFLYDDQQTIATGTATTWTELDLSSRVAPTARHLLLRCDLSSTATGPRTLSVRASGTAAVAGHTITIPPACLIDVAPVYTPGRGQASFHLRRGLDGKIDFQHDAASVTTTFKVVGFEE